MQIDIDKQKEYEIDLNCHIIIKSNISRIFITSHKEDTLLAHLYGRVHEVTNNQNYELEITAHSNIVEIKNRCRLNRGIFPRYLSLDITIPEGFSGKLTCDSMAGSVIMKTKQHMDSLTLTTTAGIVNVDEVYAKKAMLTSSGGNVTANIIHADQINLYSSGGNIEVNDALGEVNANTKSGNISINMYRLVSNVNMMSQSGNVKLALPAEVNARLDAKAPIGKIECPLIQEPIAHRNHVISTIGSGDVHISASSGQGSIVIRNEQS